QAGTVHKRFLPMKKFLLFFLSACFALSIAGAIVLVIGLRSASAPGPLAETKIIRIVRGTGESGIAQKVEDEWIIVNGLIVKIKGRIDKDDRPLQAGEYEFPAAITMNDAMEMIRAGKVYDRKITFPEGVTSWQVVQSLKELEDMSGDVESVPEEGTLLPE